MAFIRLKLLHAALALTAFSVAGCVNIVPDTVYPVGRVVPLDLALEAPDGSPPDILTARPGDMLLQQPVRNLAVLVLDNTVVPDGDVSLAVQARTVELTAGLAFYPALSVGSRNELVACSFERPATWVPRLNPGAAGSGKVCFILETLQDGALATATRVGDWTSSTFFFVSDSVGVAPQSGPYQRLFRWDPHLTYSVTEPARFSAARSPDVSDPSAPALGLRYVVGPAGSLIEQVYLVSGQPRATTTTPIRLNPQQRFPVRVSLAGAEIELLALESDVLAYRILSGFPEGASRVMDLPE